MPGAAREPAHHHIYTQVKYSHEESDPRHTGAVPGFKIAVCDVCGRHLIITGDSSRETSLRVATDTEVMLIRAFLAFTAPEGVTECE